MLRLYVATMFLGLLSGGAAYAWSCEKYAPNVVNLTGTLLTVTAYGPPNYGENPATDSLETVPVLRLDRPICVDEDPLDGGVSPPERDIVAIQLVYSSATAKFRRDLVGRHVSVSGTLFHAISGHHRTDVLMSVTKQKDVPLIPRAEVVDALAAARAVGDAIGACPSHIGRRRASTLIALCSWVSSSRYPPCNMGNPCKAATEHVRQMCPQSAPDADLPCENYGLPPEYARP